MVEAPANRTELAEAMARENCAHMTVNLLRMDPTLSHEQIGLLATAIAHANLILLDSLSLCVVPKEATDAQHIAGWKAGPMITEIYKAVVHASPYGAKPHD